MSEEDLESTQSVLEGTPEDEEKFAGHLQEVTDAEGGALQLGAGGALQLGGSRCVREGRGPSGLKRCMAYGAGGRVPKGLRHCAPGALIREPSGRMRCSHYAPGPRGSALIGGRVSKGLRHCAPGALVREPSGRMRCSHYMPGPKGAALIGGAQKWAGQRVCVEKRQTARGARCAKYGPPSPEQLAFRGNPHARRGALADLPLYTGPPKRQTYAQRRAALANDRALEELYGQGGRVSKGVRHCAPGAMRKEPSGRMRCSHYMPGPKGSALIGGAYHNPYVDFLKRLMKQRGVSYHDAMIIAKHEGLWPPTR